MYLYIRVLQKYHYHHIAGNARTPGLSFQLEFIMLEHSKYYQKKTCFAHAEIKMGVLRLPFKLSVYLEIPLLQP